jgi:hypothetical protein
MDMTNLRASRAALPAAIVLFFAAGRADASLTFNNGNFSSFTGGFGGAASQLGDSGTGGYTALTGWTVGPGSSGLLAFLIASGKADTTGSHDVRFNDTFNLWGPGAGGGGVANGLPASSPDGGNYVALDADATLSGAGISQKLGGLVPGAKYIVTFYWAAAQQHGFDGATTEAVQVGFGSNTQTTTTFNLASHAFSGWMSQQFVFTAQTATDTLSFLAVGGPNGLPPFSLLDGITVTQTPEPVAFAMVGAGLLGIPLLAKRLKKRGR